MKMSVVFLMGRCGIGGVERVTVVLANALVSRNVSVSVCAFELAEVNLLADLDQRVEVVHLRYGWLTSENRSLFRQVLIRRSVTHVINQWCVPFSVTRFIRSASSGLRITLFAVHHNLPTTNKRIQESRGLMRKIWQFATAINLRLVYERSDAYVLLSKSFVEPFCRFVWKKSASKVCVVTNPLTMCPVERKKENLILYVGRLEETQKKFSRVLGIWRKLSQALPDWKMEVVGDGPDRGCYESEAIGLERITFKGFQCPTEYYARAQMLLLTSDFEGFPLVLAEAMDSSCLPIVLGSYPAAYDIVRTGTVLGIPYDEDAFVSLVCELAKDTVRLEQLQKQAKSIASEYGVERIVDQWIRLFENCGLENDRHFRSGSQYRSRS